MAIRTDQYTNTLSVVDTVNANASLSLVPQGTGAVNIPGTGQNLLLYSSDLTNGAWGLSNITRTGAQADPFGGTTASLLDDGTANNYHYLSFGSFIATTCTLSVYAKAGSANYIGLFSTAINQGAIFNLTTGAFTGNFINAPASYSSLNVGNGWWRVSIVINAGSGFGFGIAISEDGTSATFTGTNKTVYVAAPQLEFGSALNAYIPTTTTAVYGTPSLSFSGVSGLGLQSDGSLYASSAGAGNIRLYTNNVAQEQFRVAHTASAVNYVQVTGAATGNRPAITVQGSDTNAGLNIQTKGTGSFFFVTGGSSIAQLVVTNTASSVNYINVTGGATGIAPVLSAQGSDTNIPLVLQPKGTGALQAQQTDSTATGGNARGANAVDWQTSRDTAAKVASGAQSVVGGGQYNQASGGQSVVAGGSNVVSSGLKSASVGGENNTNAGQLAFLGGGYFQTLSSNGQFGFLGGGYLNTLAGFYNVIGGGFTNSGTSGSAVTTQSATMNATTAVTLSGSNANIKVGQLITGTSITNFPNTYVAAISGTSLTLSQAASGSSTSTLSFFTPHGVVVGGGNNQATGSYSFIGGGGDAGTASNRNVASGDWSFVGGGRGNTASSPSSFVGGGGFDGSSSVLGNTASSNFAAVVCGAGNAATGYGSFIGSGAFNATSGSYSAILGGASNSANAQASAVLSGYSGIARGIIGYTVFTSSVNPIAATQGASQAALLVLGVQTTDATATVLRSNTAAASGTNQVILPNNSAYYFKGSVIANVTGGGNTKGWTIEGAIKRGANAASTALVGTPTVVSAYADTGAATWAITATADTTNGGLAITFTGQAATTIRVVAKLETTEVTF